MDSALQRLTDQHKRPFSEVARNGLMNSLDELLASGADVHIERMDDGVMSIGIVAGGRRWAVTVIAAGKAKLTARVEDQGAIAT